MTALPRAEVTVHSPLFSSFRHTLQGPVVSIGRASECAIPIKDRFLSRKHAEIVAEGDRWILKDLGSVNGTYINGSRVVKNVLLKGGDRIRLGDSEIVFETPENPTDKFLAVADTAERPSISIPVTEINHPRVEATDVSRLQTLTALAGELIEDHPMNALFGFIVDRVMQHLQPSRAALALLADDGLSFSQVELRRRDQTDSSELTISRTLLAEVVHEKRALAFMNVAGDEKLSRAKSIIIQGIHSVLCAPVMIGESVVGVLYVDYLLNQRDISEDDVRLVAQIARFAAIKLETTRLREEAIQKRITDEELKTAANIQRRLLPPAPTGVSGFTFIGSNQACRTVSGDYYDFVVRPNGRIYFVIADVSGKGVTAGLMMAGLQVAFRIFSKADSDPATLVSQLNASLRETLPRSKFVSLFLGRLDTTTGEIEYVNAGHTPPLWIRSDGVEEVVAGDILLGIITLAEYSNHKLQLAPGDSLVLFTDGVTEAQDSSGEELGAETLVQSMKGLHAATADAVASAVAESVLNHVGDSDELDDDVTILVVSRDLVPSARESEATVRSYASPARS
jgi:serine phosphatase RsbU (regulator of sigma subunit)